MCSIAFTNIDGSSPAHFFPINIYLIHLANKINIDISLRATSYKPSRVYFFNTIFS